MTNKILVLNASGTPHSVVNAEEGVTLVWSEKAFSIVDSDTVFHSQYLSIAVPSVIQLHRYVRLPDERRKVMLTRKNVCARDHYLCAYRNSSPACEQANGSKGDTSKLTMDHIVPRIKGGKHNWLNVTASCRSCNQKKGRRTLDELGWELDNTPHVPSGISVYLRSLGTDPVWEAYLV